MIGDELARLIEPTIVGLGYELSDIEVKLNEKDGMVRIFIDKRPDGIGMEDCEVVTRQVSALLDVEDPIPGNYTLEVSSPGLDRRLTKLEHFERFMNEVVRVKLRFPLDGRRNYRGTLKSASSENIEIEVDGEMFELPLATIESARLVPTL
jgi:ribosome maturation factor RimP